MYISKFDRNPIKIRWRWKHNIINLWLNYGIVATQYLIYLVRNFTACIGIFQLLVYREKIILFIIKKSLMYYLCKDITSYSLLANFLFATIVPRISFPFLFFVKFFWKDCEMTDKIIVHWRESDLRTIRNSHY